MATLFVVERDFNCRRSNAPQGIRPLPPGISRFPDHFSKRIAKAELDDTGLTGGGDAPEQRVDPRGVRIVEIGAIEEVEELGAKLEFMALGPGKGKALKGREVEGCQARSACGVPAKRAESARGRLGVGLGIEITEDSLAFRTIAGEFVVAGDVDTVLADAGTGDVNAVGDGKRSAGLQSGNSVGLPPARDSAKEPLAFVGKQVIERSGEAMAAVEI